MDRHSTEFNLQQESLSSNFLLHPKSQDAYHVCHVYEDQLTAEDDKRWIRILGYLLLYAHKEGARVYLANTIMYITSAVDRCIPWRMSAMSHMFPPLSHFPGAVNSQVSGSLWILCWANLGLLKSLHLIPDREASHVKVYLLRHRTIGPAITHLQTIV